MDLVDESRQSYLTQGTNADGKKLFSQFILDTDDGQDTEKRISKPTFRMESLQYEGGSEESDEMYEGGGGRSSTYK